MKLVYIAHPLMGTTDLAVDLGYGDPEKNVERYLHFAAWASNNGYAVISWVHHYLMHTRGLTRGDADFYLSRDRELLYRGHELWVAGDPRASSGMRDEIRWAEEFQRRQDLRGTSRPGDRLAALPPRGQRIIRNDQWLDAAWVPDPQSPLPWDRDA